MDARLRLNQLRKQNQRFKKNKFINKLNSNAINNKNKNSINDLRELITKQNRNSVKRRIGFFDNKNQLNRKQTFVSENVKNKQNIKSKKVFLFY